VKIELITTKEVEELFKQNYSPEMLEKVEITYQDIEKILNSKQKLTTTKEFILIPPPPTPLSIKSMAKIFPEVVYYDNNFNRLGELVKDWVFVTSKVVEGSENMSFEEQVRKLINLGLSIPTATELLYASLVYYIIKKKKLFQEIGSRTISSFWSGYRIYLRSYNGEFRLLNNYSSCRKPCVGMAGKIILAFLFIS
jgi:hypothetical protein